MKYILLVLLLTGLASCTEDKAQNTADTSSGAELVAQLSQAELPENAPEIGTAITEVVKPVAKTAAAEADTEVVTELKSAVNQIMWNDLVPEDFKPEKIMQKYQAEIESIAEGSPEERDLLKKMMAEFDNAPANEKLNGKTVRIPGFVSPLDQSAGVVGEFLLVPYFGSCIHSPPPPVNQTILVKPEAGKSITMNEIYEPVWVTGFMKVETATTSLAKAGYLIEGAQLEKYTEEDQTNR